MNDEAEPWTVLTLPSYCRWEHTEEGGDVSELLAD